MTIDEAKKLPCPHFPKRPHCMTTRCPHWMREGKEEGHCLRTIAWNEDFEEIAK